jgi:hypothetical protein
VFGLAKIGYMQFIIVPFEEIDKNKWNGTVHYSPHGNAFGYYWYLRSVMKEWDAIIEGDYQSVMPVPRYTLTSFEWSLLGELGPYSVNAITPSRCKSFFEMWEQLSPKKYYPFNHAWSVLLNQQSKGKLEQNSHIFLNMNNDYEFLYDQYSSDSQSVLLKQMNIDFTYQSFNKPEQFLENERLTSDEKNTLYRLFYNSIQRGVGYHTRLINNQTSKIAESFLISDQRQLYLSYLKNNNDPTTQLKLIDTLIKSNSGRPILLKIPANLVTLWKNDKLEKVDYLFMPVQTITLKERLKTLFNV